jgi:putative ABC transport system permease protein
MTAPSSENRVRRRTEPIVLFIGGTVSITAFLFLPMYLAMVIVVLVVLVLLVVDIRAHGMIVTMAARNSIRRPATTALVIGGLMVGTAVISSSFVINDTLDNMIVTQANSAFGAIDLTVASSGDGPTYFNDGFMADLAGEVEMVRGVEVVHTMVIESLAGKDVRTGLGEPSLQVMGVENSTLQGLGDLVGVDGNALSAPPSGTVYLNRKAAEGLSAEVWDELILLRGGRTAPFTVGAIIESRGLGGYNDRASAIVALPDLQNLTDHPNGRNLMLIALQGDHEGTRTAIEEVLAASAQGSGLKITSDKEAAIDSSRDFLQTFVILFFVFGSFSVIAGTALIVSIITMLGEERKGELAVLRAIGLQRALLRRLLMYEGLVYAVLASAVGAMAGVGLAYAIAYAMAGVSTLTGMQLLPYFDFRLTSLLASIGMGALITVITTYGVVSRISRLNIVRAMRDTPGPLPARSDGRPMAIGLILLGFGLMLTVAGIFNRELVLANSGFSLMGLSIGFLGRRLIGDRWAWTLGGVVTILPWIPLPGDNRLFPFSAPIEVFVLAGLFMVTACLLVIMFNDDLIVAAAVKLFGGRREYRAVVRTAMSYPLRARFRTALSIFIFGLVIFTVTTLSVVSGLVGTNVAQQITESSGGFDIIAQAGMGTPLDIDPWTNMNSTGSFLRGENVTEILTFPVAFVELPRKAPSSGEGEVIIRAIGVDARFFEQGKYPLTEWDRGLFTTEEDAWKGVVEDPTLAIVDGGLGGGLNQNGVMGAGDPFRVGDVLSLPGLSGKVEVTVAGIMKQSVLSGIFLAKSTVQDRLGGAGTGLMLMKLADGLEAGEQAVLVERTFLAYGVQALAVADLARESARTIDGMFALGRGYLALGLIIGIMGLGIITMRNIRERRTEIGIMRAIGYRRGMIISNFVLESGVVAFLGILIGNIIGVLVGYQLWLVALKDSGLSFSLDWWPILMIDLVALAAVIASVYPAARGANRIAPADVIRFE